MDDLTSVFREGLSYLVHLINSDAIYSSKKIRVVFLSDNSMRYMHVWNLEEEEFQSISPRSIVAYEPLIPECEDFTLSPYATIQRARVA